MPQESDLGPLLSVIVLNGIVTLPRKDVNNTDFPFSIKYLAFQVIVLLTHTVSVATKFNCNRNLSCNICLKPKPTYISNFEVYDCFIRITCVRLTQIFSFTRAHLPVVKQTQQILTLQEASRQFQHTKRFFFGAAKKNAIIDSV